MDDKIDTNIVDVNVEDKKVIEFSSVTSDIKTNVDVSNISKDIFIEETDLFDIKINYIKKDGKLIVENIDPEFDISSPDIKSFSVTFKYPSYLDMHTIHGANPDAMSSDQLKFNDLIVLQNSRILVLIRKWTLVDGFEKFNNMNTKFMKAIRNLVAQEIGMDGIM